MAPLRERREDIRLLGSYFLSRENQRHNRNVLIAPGAMAMMENYDWPGNVRQLENVIARVVIMSENGNVSAEDIAMILAEEASISVAPPEAAPQISETPPASTGRPYMRVQGDERRHIEEALHHSRGNKTLAARQLGISPRQLYYRPNSNSISLLNDPCARRFPGRR